MVEISEDVCLANDYEIEWEHVTEYYENIKLCNDDLIELNDVTRVFDITKMIDYFNSGLDLENCTFCKYIVEYREDVHITLFGKSANAIELFTDLTDFYEGKNRALLKIKGTEIYEAQIPMKRKSIVESLNRTYTNYYEFDNVFMFIFDYYACYDFIKHYLSKQIEDIKKNCLNEAKELNLIK